MINFRILLGRGAALLVLLLSITLPASAQDAAPVVSGNLTDACVTDYDPSVDYFADKVTFDHAVGVTVRYANHYKVVETLEPYPGATEPLTYVLVQCGTPTPDLDDFPPGTQVIEVAAESLISMSTTHLPQLAALGLVDRLVGVDSGLYVNTPEVVARVEAGELVEVGFGAQVNVEVAIDTAPDFVMTYGFSPSDAPEVLREAGVVAVVNSEWLEATPLGRAEWLKFVALFFNEEARANDVFADIEANYQAAAALAAGIPAEERVTILWNAYSTFGDAWYIPGADTYFAALLRDAGIDYVLAGQAESGSVPFAFEAVIEEGLDAPLWIVNEFGTSTLADFLARDERYTRFAAAQNGQVYNVDARVNANGGNDFYESGVTQPDVVLRDLIAIVYPDLLPGHELVYFRRLPA